MEIDWSALHSAFQMNMPEVKCYFSLEDGHVLKLPPGSQKLQEVQNQANRYVAIETIPSRIQYQWIDDFIKTVDDEALRARMETTINGKGAFRRFKDILLSLPEERRRWFEFRDVAVRKRIEDWVKEVGIEPVNPPNWSMEEPLPQSLPNRDQDVEALQDYLQHWGQENLSDMDPRTAEKLAHALGKNFRIRPLKA